MDHSDSISPSLHHEVDIVKIVSSNSTPDMGECTEEVKGFCPSFGASWESIEMTLSPRDVLQLPT